MNNNQPMSVDIAITEIKGDMKLLNEKQDQSNKTLNKLDGLVSKLGDSIPALRSDFQLMSQSMAAAMAEMAAQKAENKLLRADLEVLKNDQLSLKSVLKFISRLLGLVGFPMVIYIISQIIEKSRTL